MKNRVLLIAGVALCAGLMPTGCGLKAKSQKKSCISNLKQIGTVVEMYTNDHRSTMPSQEALVKGKYLAPGATFTSCPATKKPYEFMIPENTNVRSAELLQGRSPDAIPMVCCPKHGCVLYLDGHVGEAK